jgi:hypothetical protein
LGCLRVEHSVGQSTQANQTRHQRFVTPILYLHVTHRNDFVRVYRSRGLISLEILTTFFISLAQSMSIGTPKLSDRHCKGRIDIALPDNS